MGPGLVSWRWDCHFSSHFFTALWFVTNFSSILYWSNSEYWSQKQAQRWNIHAIILNVHVGWQSAQKLSFYWSIYPTIQWNAFIFNGTIAYIGMGKLVPMDFKIQVIAIIRSFVLAFTSGLQHWSYALWQNHWSIFVQTICIWNHCQSGAQIIKIVKLLFQFLSK